ncbi:MAG: hypothetical protein ABIT76_12390 [Chthoniobacterales bacterium]
MFPRISSALALTGVCFSASLSSASANEVRATVTINDSGTLIFQNPNSTGAPLSPSVSGTYGSSSVAASMGAVAVDLDLAGRPTGSDSATSGATWKEDYTILGGSGAGTANFTFSLTGTFTAGNLIGSDQVNYGANAFGNSLDSAQYQSGNVLSGVLPPQTYTVPVAFTYGTPFTVSGGLSGGANLSGSVGFGHIHMALRETGFTVAGGNYTASSAGGTSRGGTFASGADYTGFTLANSVGHTTTATLVGGTAGADRDISLNFLSPNGSLQAASDIVDVKGPLTDVFVLQLNYDLAAANTLFGGDNGLFLAWFDTATGVWKNAVAGNEGGTSTFFNRAYNPLTDFSLGNWGIDTTAHNVWAVVNHNSEYAVTASPTPEPASWLLLGCSGLVLGYRRFRRA